MSDCSAFPLQTTHGIHSALTNSSVLTASEYARLKQVNDVSVVFQEHMVMTSFKDYSNMYISYLVVIDWVKN